MAGVPGAAAGRLPVQPFLRAVRGLAREAGPVHAPGAPARREAVRGLLRRHGAGGGHRDRGGAGGAGLRGGVGREQLHLRGGDVEPGPCRLDRLTRAGLRIRRRPHRAGHPGQSSQRRHPRLSVRAGAQPDLPGPGGALRRGGDAGAGAQAARQGQGRVGRAARAAMDPSPAAAPAVFLARRAQPGDPGASRPVERPALPQAARLAPVAVRE